MEVIQSIDKIYEGLSDFQKDILKRFSEKYNVLEKDYLEEIVIDVDYSIKLADIILDDKSLTINKEDLALLLLYFGIGVCERTPEELFILNGNTNVRLEDLINKRDNLLRFKSFELVKIYNDAMKIINGENKSIELGFNMR